MLKRTRAQILYYLTSINSYIKDMALSEDDKKLDFTHFIENSFSKLEYCDVITSKNSMKKIISNGREKGVNLYINIEKTKAQFYVFITMLGFIDANYDYFTKKINDALKDNKEQVVEDITNLRSKLVGDRSLVIYDYYGSGGAINSLFINSLNTIPMHKAFENLFDRAVSSGANCELVSELISAYMEGYKRASEITVYQAMKIYREKKEEYLENKKACEASVENVKNLIFKSEEKKN